jgi:PiT family inorganic phosphate transporter
MDDAAAAVSAPGIGAGRLSHARARMDKRLGKGTIALFLALLLAGIGFTVFSLDRDIRQANAPLAFLPFVLLGVSLLIALAFEFVNGFHDTANAVATVIYTHSLAPQLAVVWSGFWNFLGVLLSSGAVAFGIISLLPVELILQVGSAAGFAMVFALLLAAILWNLGTWYLGLPASSSHTLIGSIIGVGLANQLMHGASGTSGVDWAQATKIGESLLLSPMVGFVGAALLLLALKAIVRNPALYREPEGDAPPPSWIRGILILTCTGVSFAHGSNDGQKGMGLIMLILIGIVPTAYALNRSVPDSYVPEFVALSHDARDILNRQANGLGAPYDARGALTTAIEAHQITPEALAAGVVVVDDIADQVSSYGSLNRVPAAQVKNVRNDMYVVSELLRIGTKDKALPLDGDSARQLAAYKKALDNGIKFIPTWVKVAVAIALGLGTMIGWKRIVITVGEKIGKQHLTYGQGASAELVAMSTIAAADVYGLPVSTTHVLSSGVAGTMAANGSGLQWSTVRNLATAWVLTLPAAIALAGCLYWSFYQLV